MINSGRDKYCFIINPIAGNRWGKKTEKHIRAFFQQKEFNFRIDFTQHKGHAKTLTQKAINDGYNNIVAVGGDGTINEVAQSVHGSKAALGIIPVGSGNGLARDLGIPMNLNKAIQRLVSGKAKEIDVGFINSQLFLCTCGIGFDAYIAYKMSKLQKRGFLNYALMVLKVVFNYKPIEAKIKVGEKYLDETIFGATIANTKQYGNNFYIAPKAKIDDGLLNLIILKPFNKLLYPIVALAFITKKIEKFKFVKQIESPEIIIQYTENSIYHYDGESNKLDMPATIGINPKKLSVIV